MSDEYVELITSGDPNVRNRSLDALASGATLEELTAATHGLDQFRRRAENLYERVRALFFLQALHQYHVPRHVADLPGQVPFEGYQLLLDRRFEEAVDVFLAHEQRQGPSESISSALAAAYRELGFQTLADQVRRSVRSVRGNQWMFRIGHPGDYPLRVHDRLVTASGDGSLPVLRERTPVRMDLSHSAWSDIFFLGMDYPEGARVINVSIDLGVRGRDSNPSPPIETYLRVIDEPVLRLLSIDLDAADDLRTVADVFDFARDYLGLVKAAIIASGLVPSGMEGSGASLAPLLSRLVGSGRGLEITSHVRDIPKGSRLAVSTNLLASLISLLMRATGQTASLEGSLLEDERRVVAARAILGEWLGGSGGGWQDSGGVWPGIKRIEGTLAEAGDPEWGWSRGCLLPRHVLLGESEVPERLYDDLQRSLVLVHGGLAQNVGPILEMVTEKYLLRSADEWAARGDAEKVYDAVVESIGRGDVRELARATMGNFSGPLQSIIPWASNHYTETLIAAARERFGDGFWGFCMLGGMSGGGMGFFFDPTVRERAQDDLQTTMAEAKRRLEHAMPFGMEPVVYEFSINPHGTRAALLEGRDALLPPGTTSACFPSGFARIRKRSGRRTVSNSSSSAVRRGRSIGSRNHSIER